MTSEQSQQIIDKLAKTVTIENADNTLLSAMLDGMQANGLEYDTFDTIGTTTKMSFERAKYEAMTNEELMALVLGQAHED